MQNAFLSFGLPLLLALAAVAATLYYLRVRENRWLDQCWTGSLLDKESERKRRGPLVQVHYWLIIRTDTGETIRKEVFSERFFDSFEPGDRLEKRKGEEYPRKQDIC